VLTGNGALVSVALPARRIEWVFTYDAVTPLARTPNSTVYSLSATGPQSPSSLHLSGSMLYFKEKSSNTMYAVDASEPSLKWTRRVDSDSAVMGADSSSLYLLGDELNAVDLTTREMKWSVRTPLGTRMGQPLVSGSHA